jgi:ribosomal protein S12 methylthiotransferase
VVGFPGETEEDFEELLDFIAEVEFDHLGAFAYSPQPGTPGAALPDPVPESLRAERLVAVDELQRSVLAGRLRERVEQDVQVIVDRLGNGDGNRDGLFEARTRQQAYGIDGLTHLSATGLGLAPGDLARARVTGSDDADLWASAIERESGARPTRDYSGRVPLDLQTAWGR